MSRYRAPTDNGGVLADPPRDDWPRLVEENRRRLNDCTVPIGGLPLNDFRAWCRVSLGIPSRRLEQPVIVTGHQPELAHPGVWVKNFAATGLARKVDGTALNLVVDNDTLKTPALHVPVVSANAAEVRLTNVPFDTGGPEEPYETRRVCDPELFATFRERVLAVAAGWGFEPILGRVTFSGPVDQPIGEKFVVARRLIEREWGCSSAEEFVSRLSETPAFLQFARHIASDADRFRAVYNHAVQSYRKQHRIRSRNHPVPDLADGELPFWGPVVNGRRTRATTVEPGIRPRALTLTLFARLCVADFFLHGIGGGKYDEVTDAIIRDYFGIDPPRYAVLSATLHLPLPGFPHMAEDLRESERRVRDLYWNPQRQVGGEGELRHRELERVEPQTRAERRERYRTFRRYSDELRPRVERLIAEAERTADVARVSAAANGVLRRRDYSWVLYPEAALREFLTAFL